MNKNDEITRRDIIGDFEKYCRYILGDTFKIKKHHLLEISEIKKSLEKNKTGVMTRKGFFMPPRHGKTLFCADLLLSYIFGRFYDKQCLYVTYSQDLAEDRKTAMEKVISSDEYKWLFPHARTKDTMDDLHDIEKGKRKIFKNTASKMVNVQTTRGYLMYAGIDSKITGIGFDIVIIDDPYKGPDEARSEITSTKIKEKFKKVIESRYEVGSMTFLIYTRWASDDIKGMLDKEAASTTNPYYVPVESFVLPAIQNKEKEWYDQREMGEPLDPDKLHEYASAEMDASVWAALWQQIPLDTFDAMFKLEHFGRYYSAIGVTQKLIVVDANYSEKSKTVDQTAISIWGKRGGRYYLVEFTNKKMDYPELLSVTSYYARKHSDYWGIIIEEKANGAALIPDMRHKGFTRVVGVNPHGKGKRERAQMVLPVIQSGVVLLPDIGICSNVNEMISQIMVFTGMGNQRDDLIDTMIYAIAYYEECGRFANIADPIVMVKSDLAERYLPRQFMPMRAKAVKPISYMRGIR